jgi:hypothetical protein
LCSPIGLTYVLRHQGLDLGSSGRPRKVKGLTHTTTPNNRDPQCTPSSPWWENGPTVAMSWMLPNSQYYRE